MSDTTYYETISSEIASNIYSELTSDGTTISLSTDDIASIIQEYLEDQTDTFSLTTTEPDYERIIQQLLNYVYNNNDYWKDIILAGSGTTLLGYMAAATAYDQYSIETSLREAFITTAMEPESVYTGTTSLGARISRKTPASVVVTLENSDTSEALTIPAYTQLTVGTAQCFNATAITFNTGVSSLEGVTLYQGTVTTETYTSSGESYQRFELGAADFSTADENITCTVGDDTYEQVTAYIWDYDEDDLVFYDTTTSKGNVSVMFGNDFVGKIPPINETITFTYAITDGASGNDTTTGYTVSCSDYSQISGTSTTGLSGGGDEKSYSYYKYMGPHLSFSKGSAITRQAIKARALQYSGVIACNIKGQEEAHPDDKNYIMVLDITILASTTWDTTEQEAFEDYMSNYCPDGFIWNWNTAEETSVDVTATIYCYQQAELDDVESQLESDLATAFTLNQDSLGYDWTLSDIYDILQGHRSDVSKYISYISLSAPTADITVDNNGYVSLGTVTLTMAYTDRGTSTLPVTK